MTYVSDHAVLRHLERTYGVDIEHYRRELDTPAVACAAEFSPEVPIVVVGRHGERLCVRDGVVTTVLEKRYGKRRRPR